MEKSTATPFEERLSKAVFALENEVDAQGKKTDDRIVHVLLKKQSRWATPTNEIKAHFRVTVGEAVVVVPSTSDYPFHDIRIREKALPDKQQFEAFLEEYGPLARGVVPFSHDAATVGKISALLDPETHERFMS